MNINKVINEWYEMATFPRKTSKKDKFIFKDSDCRCYIGGKDILSNKDIVAWVPTR